MTVGDFPDFGTPGQNVLGSAQGGVPLLRATANLGFAISASIAAAGNLLVTQFSPVTQPGYEGFFQVFLPAASGTVPFCQVDLIWIDAVLNAIIDTETFFITSGNGSANSQLCYIAGPARGDQLSTRVTNLDPAVAVTLTATINQTSHTYSHDRLLQPSYAGTAPVGFTNPAGNPAAGVLVSTSPPIGPNGTVSRLIASWNGRATLSVDDGAQANGLNVILADPGTLYSTISGMEFAFIPVAAGARAFAEVQMPNGPVLMNMVNIAGVNTITPKVSLLKREY